MMKKIIILVLAVTTSLIIACAPKTRGGMAALGQEFSLAIGQSATIKGENLKVTFVKVLEDSRCPLGVQCIQAGRARSLISIVSNNTTEIELIEPGLTDPTNRQTFGSYRIDFQLLPYPEAVKEITPDQYRLQMSVSKVK